VYGLLERRDLADPIYATLIYGPGTLACPIPQNFLNTRDGLPAGTAFNTLGFGRHQLPFVAMGVLFGGYVRVSLGDNAYYRHVELATSNAQLVDRIAGIAEALRRPAANSAQPREFWV
jgi:3-keto-5-aminohexanoate cleavage enzyme